MNNPKEESELRQLLITFNAAGLGGGDPNANANLLAGMACALANTAPPASGLEIAKMKREYVGASLLVSGSLSSNLMVDEALRPASTLQNHLIAHLRSNLRRTAEHARKPHAPKPAETQPNPSEQTLDSLHDSDPMVATAADYEEAWMKVLGAAPNPRIEDLAASPKVFVAVARARDLEAQLIGLHLGLVLVFLGITHRADFEQVGELCNALMDGRYPVDKAGAMARGNIIITDPQQLLREVGRTTDDPIAWLGRFLWLIDGNTGPDAPGMSEEQAPALPGMAVARFIVALQRMMGARLVNHSPQPVIHHVEADFWQAQLRWMKFLKEMEPSLPGITGTARKLLATLHFGLLKIATVGNVKPPAFRLAGVEAFARFLVRRMANARTEILCSAEEARKQQHKNSILQKIDEGRNDTRTIYRDLSLPAPICKDRLSELESEGVLRRTGIGNRWERLRAATPSN